MLPNTIMLEEIKEQPRILDDVRNQVSVFLEEESPDWKRFQAVHLMGCGDMNFAGRIAAWSAGLQGLSVHAHNAMDMRWAEGRLGKKDLVLAASFSGRTPRTREAALRCRREGATVWGITGNPESPLMETVERCLVLETGPEAELTQHFYAGYHHNVPQTKTFTAVLMAELLLLREAGCLDEDLSAELNRMSSPMGQAMPGLEQRVSLFLEKKFRPFERVTVLGSGPWRPLAAYGAAKLLEMAIPAGHQCLEEINHLEMFVTQKEDLLVFLAPDTPSWTRVEELLEPYGRLEALRLVLAPLSASGCKGPFVEDREGAAVLALPEGERGAMIFGAALALQFLAAGLGPALGRDIDQWVGGVRVKMIESLGLELVRGSKIIKRN